MKPNFALGLTDDGVTLWHRDATGWLRVGAVALDTPDMDTQMRDMSRIAAALAPEGVTTKLVIPDDQILYCELPVKTTSLDAQEKEIRAQLAGRTPYPVEELLFDWTLNSNKDAAQAVVVARETILEAEDFAAGHGLNPVSAVAAAQRGKPGKEPFFGATRNARKIVSDVSEIERDETPVIETGHVTLPDPEPVAPKAPEIVKAPPVSEAANASKTEKPEKTVAKPVPPVADPPAQTKSPAQAAENLKVPPDSPSDESHKSKTIAPLVQPGPKPGTERKTYASSQAAADRKTALLAKLSAAKPASLAPAKMLAETKAGLGQLLNIKKPETETASKPAATTSSPAADVASFRSRRGEKGPEPLVSAKTGSEGRDLSALFLLKARTAKAALTSAMTRGADKSVAKASAATSSKESGASAVSAPAAKSESTAWVSPSAKTGKPSQSKAAQTPASTQDKKSGLSDKPKGQPARKGPIETLQARGTSDRKQSSEAERLTIFGARNHQETQPSGTGRALLVLGGVALLLVAAAIWAAFFMASPSADLQVAEEPAQSLALEPEITAPAATDTPLDDIEAALGVEDAAQQVPLDTSEVITPAEGAVAEEEVAIPDTAMGAPETQAGRIAGLRSVALLPPQEASALPAAPAAPAPFGSEPLAPLRQELEQAAAPASVAEEDAASEADAPPALPTGEELLEIAVSEGTPEVTPPTRPEGLAPELEQPAEVALTAEPEPVADADSDAAPILTDPADESMLEITVTSGRPASTPPVRPEGIAPEQEAPAETESEVVPEALQPQADPTGESEDAALSEPSLGGIALTALRPAARPEALETETPATETTQVVSFENASDLAVSASLRPGSRPSQFSAIVQRSLRNAQPAETPAQPQPSEPIQTARAAVPAAPAIPTSASVSREATQARAINLRQINLLGVMGTSSSRRALVRLSNGRVVTVRVGETLDGGQVTAIGDDELRYTRRGRNVVLRIAS